MYPQITSDGPSYGKHASKAHGVNEVCESDFLILSVLVEELTKKHRPIRTAVIIKEDGQSVHVLKRVGICVCLCMCRCLRVCWVGV